MIIYKIVDRKHAITDINYPPDLDIRIKRWWKYMRLYYCNHAVLAFDKKKGKETLIGFLRFDKQNQHLYAGGTYILPAYRKRKIAKKLWQRAIKFAKPTYIEVTTASKGGAKLMASLVKKYIYIDWFIKRCYD
jgi:GNAT superfamily N-acetyltransferase